MLYLHLSVPTAGTALADLAGGLRCLVLRLRVLRSLGWAILGLVMAVLLGLNFLVDCVGEHLECLSMFGMFGMFGFERCCMGCKIVLIVAVVVC